MLANVAIRTAKLGGGGVEVGNSGQVRVGIEQGGDSNSRGSVIQA